MSAKQANGDKTNGEVVVGLIQSDLDFHSIVLDCSAIPFIDSSGIVAVKALVKEYKDIGVSVYLASCNTSVIDTLQKGDFFGKNGQNMSKLLFHTVHAAVEHALGNSAAEGESKTAASTV